MRRALLLALASLSVVVSTLAAEHGLQVYYNGHKSSLKPVKARDVECVPVYFPITPGDSAYNVTVHYDPKTRKVDIQRNSIQPRQRDDSPCYQCSGSGKCQNDYPAGGGKNTADQTCPMCNGTGNCWYCTGSGKSWK